MTNDIDPALIRALDHLTGDLGYASILDVMLAREALASGRIDDGEIGTYALDDLATNPYTDDLDGALRFIRDEANRHRRALGLRA